MGRFIGLNISIYTSHISIYTLSDLDVTDDQIWKDFVFKSKWRQKVSPLQVNALLTEKTWGQGWRVFVVKTKMVDTSLVSRVRTTAGTRRNNG